MYVKSDLRSLPTYAHQRRPTLYILWIQRARKPRTAKFYFFSPCIPQNKDSSQDHKCTLNRGSAMGGGGGGEGNSPLKVAKKKNEKIRVELGMWEVVVGTSSCLSSLYARI